MANKKQRARQAHAAKKRAKKLTFADRTSFDFGANAVRKRRKGNASGGS
jgi:hypothetical protein